MVPSGWRQIRPITNPEYVLVDEECRGAVQYRWRQAARTSAAPTSGPRPLALGLVVYKATASRVSYYDICLVPKADFCLRQDTRANPPGPNALRASRIRQVALLSQLAVSFSPLCYVPHAQSGQHHLNSPPLAYCTCPARLTGVDHCIHMLLEREKNKDTGSW